MWIIGAVGLVRSLCRPRMRRRGCCGRLDLNYPCYYLSIYYSLQTQPYTTKSYSLQLISWHKHILTMVGYKEWLLVNWNIYHNNPAFLKSYAKLYSSFRYSLTSFLFRHYSISNNIKSRSSYFIWLSARNYYQHKPFYGYSQKLIGLLSMYNTLLISLPNRPRSLTNSSRSYYSSTMRSQCYWVRICFILRVGSIRLITNST